MKYTTQIEGGNADGTIWQALDPAEMIEDEGTAQEVADWIAQNQTLADSTTNWRVRVWEGHDADTSTEPAALSYNGPGRLI
jgi:hypothetical protein